jgi:UDP-glucose 4-epimerase
MHYLVTGGCGFIGSHLVDRLLAKGHEVTVLDDLSSGHRENIPSHVKVVVGDITTPGIYNDLVTKIDGCFHLAAIVSVQRSITEWLRSHQVNISGLVSLFDAMVEHKRKFPVIMASSAAVYGDCKEIPIKETTLKSPLSAYGADKFSCEVHASVAASVHGIPTAAMRFFNIYGPRQDPASVYSGVISIFADRMKQNKPVSIYGDGEQSRDFVFVSDVVDALTAALQKLESKQLMHGVFNVCTGKQVTINELAKIIGELTHSRSEVSHVAARAGDIRYSLGDPSSAAQLLGFRASVALRDGLKETLA